MSKKFFTPINYVGVDVNSLTSTSLVNKQFVIDQITYAGTAGTVSNGLTKNNNNITLGGVLTNNTTFSGNFNTFYTGTGGISIGHSALNTADTKLHLRGNSSFTPTNPIFYAERNSGQELVKIDHNGTITSYSSNFSLNNVSGGVYFDLASNLVSDNFVRFLAGTNEKWRVGKAGGTKDFMIFQYNDSGAGVGTILNIANSDSAITLNSQGSSINLTYGTTINVNSSFNGGGFIFGSNSANYGASLLRFNAPAPNAYSYGPLIDLTRNYANPGAQPVLTGIYLNQTSANDDNILMGGSHYAVDIIASTVNAPTRAINVSATQTAGYATAQTIAVYANATNGTAGLAYSFYGNAGDVYISGKTGIGITTPIAKLHVKGNGELFKIDDNSNLNKFLISDGGMFVNAGTSGQSTLLLNSIGLNANKVIKYTQDLSAQYDDRSLVDKAYVISQITNAFAGTTGTIELNVDYSTSGWSEESANAYLLNSQNAAYYLNRTNHTGSQLVSTISDLSNGTSGYALATRVTQSFSMGVGSSTTITTGAKGRYSIAYRGKIVAWRLVADVSSNIVLDIWKANNSIPTNTNSIFGTKPSLTNQELNSATDLNIDVAKGDIFILEVESNDVAKYLKIELEIESF